MALGVIHAVADDERVGHLKSLVANLARPRAGDPLVEQRADIEARRPKLSQLEDNLASIDLSFSADQLKTLDEASRIELGFPYDIYTKDLARGSIYGGMADRIIA